MKRGIRSRLLAALLCAAMLVTLLGAATVATAAESNDAFADLTVEEQYSTLMNTQSDTEAEALLKNLSEEQLKALEAYAVSQKTYETPKTIVFTDAGPFMPPVNVAARRLMRAASRGTTEDNGLELSKTATANGDGTYTIRMEAYTTGTVITSTKTVPVDIVLVLDQSGSMASDFNGNDTNTNSHRRQYAMKQAVNTFIDEVNKKYDPEDADHRMSIVTFGSNASTLQEWTYVDDSGKTTLQGKISELPDEPVGATNVAAGMSEAETLMRRDYNYNGTNTQRQKVVIVFTDGVPTTSNEFDTDVANKAIASSKKLKDSGATVYTVGIFNGANKNELYGEKWDYTTYRDIPCTGEVGSYWGGSWLSDIVGSNDFEGIDIAAGNRFLNYLSSNFAEAGNVGLERGSYNPGGHFLAGGTGFKITENFERTASNYYLTAKDLKSLNSIFQTISDNIQTANIDLGSKTVVKDTVSQYFDLPNNASDVRLYTAAAKADGTFESDVAATGLTAEVKDGAVSVTGFDFNANFVSDTVKSDGTYGKKLIIEFEVTPKEEFIGGNDVPTNDWTKTAVYDKSGTEAEKFADENTTPTVNVTIKEPAFTVNNKTIYEGNSTSVSGIYNLPDTTGWQYDYVNVTSGAENITSESVSPTDCTEYKVEVKYAPKTDGTSSSGTPNDMSGVEKQLPVTVHVLKPVVSATVNDVEKYYGESYTLGNGVNGDITLEWKDNEHSDIPAAEGTAPYDKTAYSLAYTSDGFGGTVPKQDFDVNVSIMKGGASVEGAVITTTCDISDSGCTTPDTDGKYTVHVKTCSLTVTKTGGADGEPYVFVVSKDGVKYTELTIVGNNSVTISELPVGSYTIAEDEGWSWRYTPEYTNNGAVLGKSNPSDTITCTNTKTNDKWLDSYSDVVTNTFGEAQNALTRLFSAIFGN